MARKPGRPRKEQPVADSTPLRNAEQVAAAMGPIDKPVTERVAVVNDDPGVEFEVQSTLVPRIPGPRDGPALEPHPSDREASREARTETRHGVGRRKRKPLGVPTQRLQADVPSGMTGRWMNDTPGRIHRAIEGYYEFISSDGEVVQNRDGCRSEIVGTGRDGGAMKAYLMAIPTVYYEEDQAAKASKIKEVEDAIKSGEPQQAATEDRKQFYTPSEGISLRHTRVDR